MQIGRIENLSEPQGFSQADMSTVSFGLLASATEAKQLLDLGSNGAERFVPIIFGTALAANDGVYELLDVSVEADPNLEAAGLRQVSVSARCVNQGRQVANSQLLVRGDNRNRTAAVGLTGPLYRVAVPDPATTVTSFNAGPAGFDVEASALPTLRGDVRRLIDRTQAKEGVRIASTTNRALSGLTAIDGVTPVASDRVLLKDQTTKSQNGIYVAASGAWSRATDADSGTELDFAQVGVAAGTANGGTTWFNPNKITIGTTAYDWQQAPAFGLRESDRGGPVSISYQTALADWYDGACTVVQGGTVVTGTRVAASGAVSVDNGLVKVGLGVGADLEFEMASGSPLAFKGRASGQPHRLAFLAELLGAYVFTAPSIVTNTPDVVALRFRGTGVVADVSVVRGCRTVTVALSSTIADRAAPVLNAFSSPAFGAATALTGPGFTAAGNFTLLSATDDFDNQIGLSYSGTLNATVSSAPATTNADRAHAFGVHAVVDGADSIETLSREWFAMLAQQTSAGVV